MDTDKDAVVDQVNDVESRWKSLEGEADKASKSLEDKSSKLSEQYDILNDLSKQVKECEDILASHNALGANAYDARSMERVKVNITYCLKLNMFVIMMWLNCVVRVFVLSIKGLFFFVRMFEP